MSDQENNNQTETPETDEQRAQRKLAEIESALFVSPPQSNPFAGEITVGTST